MGRRRTKITERKIQEWTSAGRGLGSGADYKPWLDIHAFSSDGLAVRRKSRLSGRTCHLMSKLESHGFLEAEWEDAAEDVREQFGLDRERTRRIAAEMGVRHPAPDGTDIVMTTDMLVTMRGGGMIALSFKYVADLKEARTLELLEVERRYWAELDVPWFLVTEVEVDEARCRKLQWLHEWYWLDDMDPPSTGSWQQRCEVVVRELARASAASMAGFIGMLEAVHGFGPGEAISAIRHLAARKLIGVDLSGPFRATGPFSQIWHISEDASTATTGSLAA